MIVICQSVKILQFFSTVFSGMSALVVGQEPNMLELMCNEEWFCEVTLWFLLQL